MKTFLFICIFAVKYSFVDVCPNHDFLALHEYEKQFCLKFMVKTKKKQKSHHFKTVSNFSVFIPK